MKAREGLEDAPQTEEIVDDGEDEVPAKKNKPIVVDTNKPRAAS